MAVEVLHVGDVAAEAHDGGVGESAETLDIGETGKGAVGCYMRERLSAFMLGAV